MRSASILKSRVALLLTKPLVNIFSRLQTDRADLADIYFCYRLLLGRKAEDEGWKNWSQHVASGMTIAQLVTDFLESQEFRKNHAFRARARVESADFVIYVDPNDASTGNSIFQFKTYEPHVTAIITSLLKPEHVFLDIGCNVGWFILLAASIARKGKVIGLEPNHNNLQLLYQSIYENRFDNITIFPYAATDRSALLQLSGHAGSGFVHSVDGSDVDYVQGFAIDELLKDESRIDLVKVDIEGHEPVALQGMRKTLHKYRPIVISEFHPKLIREVAKQEPQEYLDTLVSMGYRLSVIELTANVIDCVESADVVDYWRKVNRRHRTGDTMHLDILAIPNETIS